MATEDEDEIEYTLTWSRYVLYFYTMGLIGGGSYCFSIFTSHVGLMYVLLVGLGFLSTLLLYVYMPYKLQTECLSPLLVKGRSFLGLYHLGLLLSLPVFVLFFLSFGRLNSLPQQAVSHPDFLLSIGLLKNQSLPVNSVFKVSNGFVAVNSTVSIVTTLSKHPLPAYDSLYFQFPSDTAESYSRVVPSVYYAEAKVLQKPYDDFELTEVQRSHVDARDQITVAPLFETQTGCLTRFPPVHINCALENKVIGFALYKDQGLCRDLAGVTVCKEYVEGNVQINKEHPLKLSPTYNCSSNEGLCGRIAKQPSEQLTQQIVNRMTANGWMIDENTANLMWIEVNDLNYCELNPDSCKQSYTTLGYAALGLLIVALVSIFSALLLDLYADLLVARLANDYQYRQVAKINTLYTS
jgi:hypothetical protein